MADLICLTKARIPMNDTLVSIELLLKLLLTILISVFVLNFLQNITSFEK